MASITLSGVGKTYDRRSAPSVTDLDLHIEDGEFLCFLGPSGCGKSTTLRMIAGLEPLSAGAISIGERVVDDVPRGVHIDAEHRGLGLVFQSYALWPHLTVRDNVGFGPATQRLPKAEQRKRVDAALDTLAIAEHADRYPSALSGGQQQRVAIARTLAAGSQVLLLDEPLSNLDARLRLEMRAEFQRIHRETGTTMVFVTHDQWEAMTLATRIVVMAEGRVQQIGTPSEIYDRPVNRFVAEFMGNPPINIVERQDWTPMAVAFTAWAARRGIDAASAGIRPESLRVVDVADPVPGDAFAVSATVTALLPTGGSWIVELTDGERLLFATFQNTPPFQVGQSVRVWADSLDVHLFDAAGMRLQREAVAA
jgi:iron(III) transport system ATP-binding protein